MSIRPGGSPAGRVAIVTGGSRGVGRATIRRLAARGYAVVVNYLHDQRAAESAVEAILENNGSALVGKDRFDSRLRRALVMEVVDDDGVAAGRQQADRRPANAA